MTTSPGFRGAMVIMALVAVSAVVSVPMASAAPLPEGATASGGVVPQSPNCSAGREEDEGCVPRGPGSPTRPGVPGLPPIPPITPPVGPPIMPPPGIPPEELPGFIGGTAKATLHLTDDHQDVTYTSNEVMLLFMKRPVQDILGNTQYVLYGLPKGGLTLPGSEFTSMSMTWTATGQEFGCTIEGQAIITFPLVEPDPNIEGGDTLFDPTRHNGRPAFGYLNVVGPDGGDFHSVMVSAFDPDARVTKTCPGIITKESFDAGYLLHTVREKNTYEAGRIIFKGKLSFDSRNPLDLLPPGTAAAIPDEMREVISEAASGSGPRTRYTWEWNLWPTRPAGPGD